MGTPTVVSVEAVLFKQSLICCSTDMKLSPEVLTSNPPQYQYSCNLCGSIKNSTQLYPYISFDPQIGE